MGDDRLDPNPLTRLRVPHPVDRYRYVSRRCRGLRVLDLGAYDETEVRRPQHGSWRWLHAEIAAEASEVLGVDAAEEVRCSGEISTHCGTRIVYGSVEDLGAIIEDFKPQLIVAGELIEHTPDTLGWLSRLACESPGMRLLLTTPNATSIVNMLLAFADRESCHPDHLHIYSVRTLRTLASRVPLRDVTVRPYYYDPHLFYGKVPRVAAPVVAAADLFLLKPVQYLFPLASFGLILEGALGRASEADV
jgi:hypothetical protein